MEINPISKRPEAEASQLAGPLSQQEHSSVKESTERFATWRVTWRDVGIVKYLLSRIFKTYAKEVREDFKSVLKEKLEARAVQIMSGGVQEEQKEQWNALLREVESIPKGDMKQKDKVELLMGIQKYEENYKKNTIKNVKEAILGKLGKTDDDFIENLKKAETEQLEKNIKSREDRQMFELDFAKKVIQIAIESKAKTSTAILEGINLSPHFTVEQKAELSKITQKIAVENGQPEGEFKQIKKGGQDYSWVELTREEASKRVRYAAAASCAIRGENLNALLYADDRVGVIFKKVKPEDRFMYEHRLQELSKDGALVDINDELKSEGTLSDIKVNSDLDNVPGYYDPTTGLKFVILSESGSNNLTISFGPALSEIDKTNKDLNSNFNKTQLKVSATQLLGAEIPDAYKQAAKIVEKIKEKYPDKNVILTGYCFGGSLAQYAGLKHGVETHCFNGLPLGAALQKDIGDEKLNKADELVTQVSVRNEWASDMHGIGYIDRFLMTLGFKTPANFGKRYVIPPAQSGYSSHERHMKISHCMLVHAGWRMAK